MPDISTPILSAYAVKGTSNWAVWCPSCGAIHRHGAGEGHRIPHCGSYSKPHYAETGYSLRYGGDVESPDEVIPATALLAAVDRPYVVHRDGQQQALVRGVLRNWFGRGPDFSDEWIWYYSKRVTGNNRWAACFDFRLAEWWVHLLDGQTGEQLAKSEGRGLVDFGATLFGVGPEIIADDLALLLWR